MFIYLLKLLIFRIWAFFVHWYRDGALFAYGKLLGVWRRIDRAFGMRVNLRFLFKPLYQERNITGYVLGFLFRLLRLGVGGVFIIILSSVICLVFLIWLAIPAYLIIQAVRG
ncbi:hypothetical protein A2755_01215 [Candidatus Wolfebacteria bacterium RIFCSPHIGHO2_01_FULL_48_22]|uniref:Uncharacterized protein n=2 Tax=Candidatus Wolfeibacteriota TaxID=1752735 RepID=A0A1F8DWD2_9BACT|nr:MAG: hypothetical protein A2755_01215 [Candidatus Wolfebacteria bacterium RIFCSPHIGHO2_01_FULL_48_22]OGM93926.1 MAG: hypothetical protein A2935_03580 [Candidatus Wolfebacteria bacterium RIFCSPLOWO2_01_FULL_47_17b]